MVNAYTALNLSAVIDYDKFNQYAIVHHSTVIEGSTLTATDTEMLLSEGITPKGKPFLHSQMVIDHYKALQFVLVEARKQTPITASFIRQINAQAMAGTGSIYNLPLGQVDASKGDLRKANVSAGDSYFVNYDKVPGLLQELTQFLDDKRTRVSTVSDKLLLSFDAHYNLVTIHPFMDGNGRTSRLLMNYLQAVYHLPLAIVFADDKTAYIDALKATRSTGDISVFRNFMTSQYKRQLTQEIASYREQLDNTSGKGTGFRFLF